METDEWIEELKQNKEFYKTKIKNTDILNLREKAAEHGFEMTPEEVQSYMDLILEIVSD